MKLDKVNRLIIVGNGFDIYHGVPSRYLDFGNYLQCVDNRTFDLIDRYFSVDDDFWSTFEAHLAEIDVEQIIDDASIFLSSYGADDWSDSGHHDYQYELERVVEAISATMKGRFAEWVSQLAIPERAYMQDRLVSIDPTDLFLNFNYTDSLQLIYGVPDDRILHIHGRARGTKDQIVLGHGWNPDHAEPRNSRLCQEDADTRVLEGNDIVDQYFSVTFKPTNTIIERNSAFFVSLSPIEEIWVLGHSVAEVDQPYFQEICGAINMVNVRWRVSYYDDLNGLTQRIASLGIERSLIDFRPLSEFRGS